MERNYKEWSLFCSKIALLLISLWACMNSITMIRIQPDINLQKVRYYGQKDLLAGVVGAIWAGMDNPAVDMLLGPIDLGTVPNQEGISLLWSPIPAGCSAWLLCMAQVEDRFLELRFDLPDAESPDAGGQSGDKRELALSACECLCK